MIDESGGPGAVNLGVPADTAGLIATQMDSVGLDGGVSIDAYPLKDCCTTKTEYALSVDLLDAALLCPEAADRLLARDDRYERVGPVLVNSDVLVERTHPVRVVAVGIGRDHQEVLARHMWGQGVEVKTALASVVGFALVDGEVDAAVMDFLDARSVEASRTSAAAFGEDVVSYELVVRRGFREGPQYAGFMRALSIAVRRLNDHDVLADAVRQQTGRTLSEEEVGMWIDSKTRFVDPSP